MARREAGLKIMSPARSGGDDIGGGAAAEPLGGQIGRCDGRGESGRENKDKQEQRPAEHLAHRILPDAEIIIFRLIFLYYNIDRYRDKTTQ